MAQMNKDFFLDHEVLIVGYPLADDPSMKIIMQAFLNNNIKVFALNKNARDDSGGIRIYTDFAQLPHIPQCAYIYLEKHEISSYVRPLADIGVTRVLFHSKKDVDPAQLDECQAAGLETAIACPLMLLGKGLHRFHAWLAGVR